MKFHKSNKIHRSRYVGFKTVVFTMVIDKRVKIFHNKRSAKHIISILSDVSKKYNVLNYIYCFMPDHVHFILRGKSSDSDLWAVAKYFKQKTTMWFNKHAEDVKWLKGHYAHILKDSERLKPHIRYIAENPVKAGIVKDWKGYEFTGSLDFEVENLF